jgi:hypothetical protein
LLLCVVQIHLYHVLRNSTSKGKKFNSEESCKTSSVSSRFDGHGRCKKDGNRVPETSMNDDRSESGISMSNSEMDSFDKYFHRNRSALSQHTLLPLDFAAAVAEKCYRQSYFSAFLRLLATGRRCSDRDLASLLRWGGAPIRMEVAPKAVLIHLRGNLAVQADLQHCLDEVLAIHLRQVDGCPGHYVMAQQASSSINTMQVCSDGNPKRDERQSTPMLVRAGWSSWARPASERHPAAETSKSCHTEEISPSDDPLAARPQRRRGAGGWVIEVYFLEDLEYITCENDSLGQIDADNSDPFQTKLEKSIDSNCIGPWDSVLRQSVDSTGDSDDSDYADDENVMRRCAPIAHRDSLRLLFRAVKRAAAASLLSRPSALADDIIDRSISDNAQLTVALPVLLRALRYPGSSSHVFPIFVDVPVRFAPGIDLDIGLKELESHLKSRATLKMRPVATIKSGSGSGRPSQVLISHSWLHVGDVQDSTKHAMDGPGISPCWFLAEVRDGSCRAAVYRTSDSAGPTADWIRDELTRACQDASRTLLLHAMHASRRLNPLLAPLSPKPGNHFAVSVTSAIDNSSHAAQLTSSEVPVISSSIDISVESEVSIWACPKVCEIRLQVIHVR